MQKTSECCFDDVVVCLLYVVYVAYGIGVVCVVGLVVLLCVVCVGLCWFVLVCVGLCWVVVCCCVLLCVDCVVMSYVARSIPALLTQILKLDFPWAHLPFAFCLGTNHHNRVTLSNSSPSRKLLCSR